MVLWMLLRVCYCFDHYIEVSWYIWNSAVIIEDNGMYGACNSYEPINVKCLYHLHRENRSLIFFICRNGVTKCNMKACCLPQIIIIAGVIGITVLLKHCILATDTMECKHFCRKIIHFFHWSLDKNIFLNTFSCRCVWWKDLQVIPR